MDGREKGTGLTELTGWEMGHGKTAEGVAGCSKLHQIAPN
jgi:hypothetical protein